MVALKRQQTTSWANDDHVPRHPYVKLLPGINELTNQPWTHIIPYNYKTTILSSWETANMSQESRLYVPVISLHEKSNPPWRTLNFRKQHLKFDIFQKWK